MNSIVQFSVNIAMEGTITLVLVILLATCLLQKKFFSTTVPLISLLSFIILMHITHIVAWSMLIYDVPNKYGEAPMRVVYILDYFSTYYVSVSFYYYVVGLVKDAYIQKGITYRPNRLVQQIIIAWGLATGLIYVVSLFNPYIYHVEAGTPIFSIPAFIFMHITAKLAYVCAILFIIRHKKVISRHETVVLICFMIFTSVVIVVDELLDSCISYVVASLFTFVLYISIEQRKGLLLEKQEKEIAESKTQIMLSQMQPHFLYNVLTTISSMCEMQNATQARDVVNRFADYLRNNLDSLGKNKTIAFEKELEHVKTYLWLEKIRFEDLLNIRYEIGTTDFTVPSLIVQPMVENAVKHGIHPKEDAGCVTIKTYETPEEFCVVVEDDGVGFDVDAVLNGGGNHIGIENVSNRLRLICNGSCDISSEIGKGTVVTLHIPKGDKF